jgi:hypothetical protein
MIAGYEYHATSSGLEARSPMNCASARYAYAHAFGIARRTGGGPPSSAMATSLGIVVCATLSQPPGGGCGTYRSVVTHAEYSSGTAFRFRLRESSC